MSEPMKHPSADDAGTIDLIRRPDGPRDAFVVLATALVRVCVFLIALGIAWLTTMYLLLVLGAAADWLSEGHFGARLVLLELFAGEDLPLWETDVVAPRWVAGFGLLTWVAGFGLLALLLQLRSLRVRTVRIDSSGVALLQRDGRALRTIAREAIIAVTRVPPPAATGRMCMPGFRPTWSGPLLTRRNRYEISVGKRLAILSPVDAARFEALVAERLGIVAQDPTARSRWLMRAIDDSMRVALAVVLVAALGHACLMAVVAEDRGYIYVSSTAMQFALREGAPSRPRDAAEWTSMLEKVLAGGNPDAVKLVVEQGRKDGAFDLSGFDAANSPCIRSLSRYAREGDFPGMSRRVLDAKRSAAATLQEYLDSTEGGFWISAEDAARRLRVRLENPDTRGPCVARGGYRYYFGAAPRAKGKPPVLTLADAVATGDDRLVARLIEQGAALDATNWLGQTPLMLALESRQPVAGKLLKLSADRDRAAADRVGRTVAFYAIRSGNAGLLGPELGGREKTSLGETLLHAAVMAGDLKTAQDLIGRGWAVNVRTADGRTLMHYARGSQMILTLLDKGLDVNATDTGGRTPLHHLLLEVTDEVRTAGAARLSAASFETARMLIAAGADRRLADAEGRAPAALYALLFEGERPAIRRVGASVSDQRRIDAWTWLLDPATNIAAAPRLRAPG